MITLENIDFFYILTKQNAIIDNTEVNLRGSLCSESHYGLNSINMISLSNLIVMKEKMKEDKIYLDISSAKCKNDIISCPLLKRKLINTLTN